MFNKLFKKTNKSNKIKFFFLKKNPVLFFLLLILSYFYFGCSKDNGYSKYNYSEITKLKETTNIKHIKSKILFNGEGINALSAFKKIGQHLVILDRKDRLRVKLIDYSTGKIIIAFGAPGQGPSEFIGASDVIVDPNDNNAFWIYDLSALLLKKFTIKKILEEHFEPEKIIKLFEGPGAPLHVVISPKNDIYGIGAFYKGRVALYDMDGNFVKLYGDNPVKIQNDKFASQHSHGFDGNLIFNSKTNSLSIAVLMGSIIENIDLQTNTFSAYLAPDWFFPEYNIVRVAEYNTIEYTKETRVGFYDLAFNDNAGNVYLLYCGNAFFDRGKNFPSIYVLDKTNNIANQLKLDQNVINLTMDNVSHCLLGGTTDGKILKLLDVHGDS